MQTKTPLLVLIAVCAFGQAVYAGPMTTREKLETIILPKVQFEDADLRTVIKYLKQRSKELDPEGKGVNIILYADPNRRIAPVKKEVEKDPFEEFTQKDKADAKKKPVTTKTPKASEVKVTMDFDNVPLGAIVDYLCKGTGFKHRVDEHALIVAHPKVALDPMKTRIFPVGPGFLDAKRTRTR